MNINKLFERKFQSAYIIIGLLTTVIIFSTAYIFYSSNNKKQLLQSAASSSYQEAVIINEDSSISNTSKATRFQILIEDYPDTSYGIFSSWQLANLYLTPTKIDMKKSNINIKNIPKAIRILQQSAEVNSKNNLTNVTKTRLARLYLTSNQTDKAIKTLKSISNLEENAYPMMLLGHAYLQQEDKTKAILTWENAKYNHNISLKLERIISQLINNITNQSILVS